MELIGITVFGSSSKKSSIRKKKPTIIIGTHTSETKEIANQEKPPLPDPTLKIGEYVYTALQNLANSGFVFLSEQIDEMCTPEWSEKNFHTTKPFMKRYIPRQTDNKGADGRVRFKSQPFAFGDIKVYISKEWYERQREFFNSWYRSL